MTRCQTSNAGEERERLTLIRSNRYKDKFVAVKTLKGVATKDQMESFRKEFEVLRYFSSFSSRPLFLWLTLFLFSLTTSPYLIHFYGASIDESNPERPVLSIVVEYCERGTLYLSFSSSLKSLLSLYLSTFVDKF